MFWLPEDKETPEATWEDYSIFYRDFQRNVTLSEYDHLEKTQIYTQETNIPQNDGTLGRDYNPMTFITTYYIRTHQGI